MSKIIGEKENVHALIFLSSYITDYSSDTVAKLSCHITFTGLVSFVCIRGITFLNMLASVKAYCFENLISGPCLMDSAYESIIMQAVYK
jgi:hypothetical protein